MVGARRVLAVAIERGDRRDDNTDGNTVVQAFDHVYAVAAEDSSQPSRPAGTRDPS